MKQQDRLFSTAAVRLAKARRLPQCRNFGVPCRRRTDNPYFIEMNPRIQVEHTVTEHDYRTGYRCRLRFLVAEGYPLDSPEEINIRSQEDVKCNGYSIQTRITTEDPMQWTSCLIPERLPYTVQVAGNGIRS